MTDIERLLLASIEIAELKEEIAFLEAANKILSLRLERQVKGSAMPVKRVARWQAG
jgi:hypothetical protein